MTNKLFAILSLALPIPLNSQPSIAHSEGASLTYQGRFQKNGSPADGSLTITPIYQSQGAT